jgi:RNA polymerase primary sigma factor
MARKKKIDPQTLGELDFDFNLDDINISDYDFSEDDVKEYLENDNNVNKNKMISDDNSFHIKLTENSTENNFIQMSKFKALSGSEEFEIAKRIEIGIYAQHLLDLGKVKKRDIKDYEWIVEDGKRAKTIFANANRKLISYAIKKIGTTYADYNTMTIYGQMGLDLAISKYDYKKGYRFSTMGLQRIDATIRREQTKNAKLVKKPQHMVEKIGKMNKFATQIETEIGREPTLEELAAVLEVSVEEVKSYKDANSFEKSIYDEIGDGDGSLYIDTVEDENLEGAIDAEVTKEEQTRLYKVLALLQPKERKAFELKYGICGEQKIEDKKKIGTILKVGDQQVDNLVHRAEAKVCHPAFGLLSD